MREENGMAKPTCSEAVYLTFDDGPSPNTAKILDLLGQYDCRAAFFVVGQNIPGNEALLERMVRERHSVGVHCYSHDYAHLYRSEEAFWADNRKARECIKQITGVQPVLLRFPGGASNTVSARYCSGIMSALTARCQAPGYTYFDWNIDAGDAAAAEVPVQQLYENVMAGLHRHHKTPVVLMHDAAAKHTTVAALAKLLPAALSEGYRFAALDESVAPVHHPVSN